MIRVLLSTRLGEIRMSQSELARKTGIRLPTIHELYHEFSTRISFENLDKICEVLDCEVSDILVRVPNSESLQKRQKVKRVKDIQADNK